MTVRDEAIVSWCQDVSLRDLLDVLLTDFFDARARLYGVLAIGGLIHSVAPELAKTARSSIFFGGWRSLTLLGLPEPTHVNLNEPVKRRSCLSLLPRSRPPASSRLMVRSDTCNKDER